MRKMLNCFRLASAESAWHESLVKLTRGWEPFRRYTLAYRGDYLSKPVTEKESSDEANGKLNIGASSMQGWRTNQEDAHNVLLDFDVNASLFAVYDGHGGREVAVYYSQNLPNYIKDTEVYKNCNFRNALENVFLGFNDILRSPKVIAKLRELWPRGTAECSTTSSDNADESSTNSATTSVSPDTSKPVEENGSLQKPELHVELADSSESDSKSKADDFNPKNNEIEANVGGDQPNQNGEVKQSAKEETPPEVEIPQEDGETRQKGMMSEGIPLTFPFSKLEGLRCFICQGYLSCSPVRVLADGNNICGRCAPLNPDTPMHRNAALETFLSMLSFPCAFKKYGCTETLLFGKVSDHESKCVYKLIACPINSPTTCPWEGQLSRLLPHFNDNHSDVLKEKAEFKLELDKDAQGVLVATENALVFVVKYFYNANERILKYDVRFCTNQNGFEVFSRLQLSNPSDTDCNINLKMNKCSSYDETFYGTQNIKILNLNKFLEYLNEPDCVVVSLKLMVSKSNVTNMDDCEVNLDLTETLRCPVCQNYLLSPLFELDGKTICSNCAEGNSSAKLSNDANLLNCVNEAVYTCRWRGCNFAAKSDIFKDHEIICEFRQRHCVYDYCEATFQLSEAVAHFETHHYSVYVSGKITYKISFPGGFHGDIIYIKNKRILLIDAGATGPITRYVHRLSIRPSKDDNGADINGIVVFEHQHCKLKSKKFTLNTENNLKIRVTLSDLPPCFKNYEELTVTVELNV